MELTTLALVMSFAAGAVSFLSPCVLPLVPGYVSYVAGRSVQSSSSLEADRNAPLAALGLSAFFVLGFSTVFVALGASATALGQLLLSYRYEANVMAGAVVVAFGLLMTGLIRCPWLARDFRFHLQIPGGRPFSAYVLGVAFAFGWTPCIGPVLGAILTTSAVSTTVSNGIAFLSAYSLGLGLPFLAAALFTDRLFRRLKHLRGTGRALQTGAGVAVVGMGVAMITGQLTAFSYWLLQTFPVFSRVG